MQLGLIFVIRCLEIKCRLFKVQQFTGCFFCRGLKQYITNSVHPFVCPHAVLSSRQHAGLWDGWAAVPAVLYHGGQVITSRPSPHGNGHQIPHHGFPCCTGLPPTHSLLQRHRFLLFLHLCYSNNKRII